MPTEPKPRKSRRNLYLGLFVGVWVAAALGAVFFVKPDVLRDPHDHFLKAQELAAQGDREAAIREMDSALRMAPDNVGYLTYQGALAMDVGDTALAEQRYAAAVRLEPANPEAVLGLGRSLLALNRPEEALETLHALPASTLDTLFLERRAGMLAEHELHEQAARDFEELLRRDPGNAASHRQLAASLMAMNDWVRAQTRLRFLVDQGATPEDRDWATEQLAIALRAMGQLEETYDRLAGAATADNLRTRADLAMEMQRFAEAARLYRELAEAMPTDPEVQNNLAVALRASGNLEEAYRLFSAVPTQENLEARAQLAMQLERFDEAVMAYRQLRERSSENQEFADNLAIALRVLGEAEQAYELFQAFPSMENLEARAGLAMELERYEDAATLYRELAALRPGDGSVAEALAFALDRALPDQDVELAEDEYRRLVESGQATEQSRVRYAWLLMRTQRFDRAYQVVSPVESDSEEVMQLKADAAFLAGRMRDALPHLRHWLELHPDDAPRWQNLADAQDALGNTGEAMAAQERLVRLRPGDVPARLRLADLQQRAGRLEQATASFTSVLDHSPGHRPALLGLARIHELQGNHGAAANALRQVVQAEPSPDPELVLRLARLSRWQEDIDAAGLWYRRLLSLPLAAETARIAQVELTETLVNANKPDQADAFLVDLGADLSDDPELLVLTARVAMLRNEPTRAVAVLERLASIRALASEEQRWLAGQYRLAGDAERSLALYEALYDLAVAANVPESPENLEALGDLRMELDWPEGALEAYAAIPAEDMTPDRELKLARAANRAGNPALAVEAYSRALAAMPENEAVMLEAARFMINVGAHDQGLKLYEQVVTRSGHEGLLLELALANLAAQRFEDAGHWADLAVQAEEGEWRAVLALVQALHLQGKTRDADNLLRDHEEELREHPEGKMWLGYVAVARDRHLQAFLIFDELIKDRWGDPGNLWLWRGIAATRRGDFARAEQSFQRAAEYGRSEPTMRVLPPVD